MRSWKEAEAIRAYCDAVEARHGIDTVAADADAAQWLALARDYADQAQQLPRMPPDPEMTHERLKPYLRGWSHTAQTGGDYAERAQLHRCKTRLRRNEVRSRRWASEVEHALRRVAVARSVSARTGLPPD